MSNLVSTDAYHGSYFRNNFDPLWNKLKLKIAQSNQTDGVYICNFITNLDRNNKVLLLLGGLTLPLDSKTNIQIKRFISAAVCKIYKLRQERLRELEAPWLANIGCTIIKLYCLFVLCSSVNFKLLTILM